MHRNLLRCHVLHQGVHLRAVLSNIPAEIVQMAVQVFDALHLRLVGLVHLRWIISMPPDSCGVGTVDPRRSVYRQLGAFVRRPLRSGAGRKTFHTDHR